MSTLSASDKAAVGVTVAAIVLVATVIIIVSVFLSKDSSSDCTTIIVEEENRLLQYNPKPLVLDAVGATPKVPTADVGAPAVGPAGPFDDTNMPDGPTCDQAQNVPPYDCILTWYGVQTDGPNTAQAVDLPMYINNAKDIIAYLDYSKINYTGICLQLDPPTGFDYHGGKPANYSAYIDSVVELVASIPLKYRVGFHAVVEEDAAWQIELGTNTIYKPTDCNTAQTCKVPNSCANSDSNIIANTCVPDPTTGISPEGADCKACWYGASLEPDKGPGVVHFAASNCAQSVGPGTKCTPPVTSGPKYPWANEKPPALPPGTVDVCNGPPQLSSTVLGVNQCQCVPDGTSIKGVPQCQVGLDAKVCNMCYFTDYLEADANGNITGAHAGASPCQKTYTCDVPPKCTYSKYGQDCTADPVVIPKVSSTMLAQVGDTYSVCPTWTPPTPNDGSVPVPTPPPAPYGVANTDTTACFYVAQQASGTVFCDTNNLPPSISKASFATNMYGGGPIPCLPGDTCPSIGLTANVDPATGSPYQTFSAASLGGAACQYKPPPSPAGAPAIVPQFPDGCPGNLSRVAWYICYVNAKLRQLAAPGTTPQQVSMMNWDAEGNGATGLQCATFQFLYGIRNFGTVDDVLPTIYDPKTGKPTQVQWNLYQNGKGGMPSTAATSDPTTTQCGNWATVPVNTGSTAQSVVPSTSSVQTYGDMVNFQAAPEYYWFNGEDMGGVASGGLAANGIMTGLHDAGYIGCPQSAAGKDGVDAGCGCRRTVYETYGHLNNGGTRLLKVFENLYTEANNNVPPGADVAAMAAAFIPYSTPTFSIEHVGNKDQSDDFGECINARNFANNLTNKGCQVNTKCAVRCGVANFFGNWTELCFKQFLDNFVLQYGAKSVMVYDGGFLPKSWLKPGIETSPSIVPIVPGSILNPDTCDPTRKDILCQCPPNSNIPVPEPAAGPQAAAPLPAKPPQHALPPQAAPPQHALPPQAAPPQHALPPQAAAPQHALPPQAAPPQHALPPQAAAPQHALPPQAAAPQHAAGPKAVLRHRKSDKTAIIIGSVVGGVVVLSVVIGVIVWAVLKHRATLAARS